MNMERGVIKIGGSLLRQPLQLKFLRQWLGGSTNTNQPGPVLLFGGGPVADAVRELDEKLNLEPGIAHQAALETMRATSRIGASLLESADWTDCLQVVLRHAAYGDPKSCLVFDCSRWLNETSDAHIGVDAEPRAKIAAATEAPGPDRRHGEGAASLLAKAKARRNLPAAPSLPAVEESWEFTSDSIAATLAVQLRMCELTLVKSQLFSAARTLAELAGIGAVDACFPRAAAEMSRIWIVAFDSHGYPLKRCLEKGVAYA